MNLEQGTSTRVENTASRATGIGTVSNEASVQHSENNSVTSYKMGVQQNQQDNCVVRDNRRCHPSNYSQLHNFYQTSAYYQNVPVSASFNIQTNSHVPSYSMNHQVQHDGFTTTNNHGFSATNSYGFFTSNNYGPSCLYPSNNHLPSTSTKNNWGFPVVIPAPPTYTFMKEYHNMAREPVDNNIPMNRYNSNIQSGANYNLSIPNTANYYIPIPYSDQENRATPSIYINQSQNIVNITNASHLNHDNQIPSMHHVSLTLFPKSI